MVTKCRPKASVAQKELRERKLSLPYVRKIVRKVGVKGLLEKYEASKLLWSLGKLARYERGWKEGQAARKQTW